MLKGRDLLVLRGETGRSERQWKSVLSWMLGVAGARHVLAYEGYRWIAPLSAFYPGAIEQVDLSAWHSSFPRCSVTATRAPDSSSRLRPDYVALRSTSSARSGGLYEWAVAEAKGTRRCLTSARTCPTAWSNQVRNVMITVNGSRITIPRHLVIATRVNPNASSRIARRIQVRAWNRTDKPEESFLDSDGAIDIVSAHLFGLFKGMGLRENALAIALSVEARKISRSREIFGAFGTLEEDIARVADRAEREFFERTRRSAVQAEVPNVGSLSLETDLGPIVIDIAEPVLKLARYLRVAETAEAAAAVLQETDSQLDVWEKSRRAAAGDEGTVVLPFGVELPLPREFERRR